MNLGIGELVVVILNGLLVVGIPLILIVVCYSLLRRLRNLESRVERLEADAKSDKKPGG